MSSSGGDSASSASDGSHGIDSDGEEDSSAGDAFSSSDSSDDGSSDFHSSDDYDSDDDDGLEEYEADARDFEHLVLNFCSGDYDTEIQSALDHFTTNNPATNSDDEEAHPDVDTLESIARENLIKCLEHWTEEIRLHSTPREGRAPTSFPVDLRHDGPMVSHHDELIPHWENLFQSLEEHKASLFENLRIPKVELNGAVLGGLAEHLRGRVEKCLTLVQNDLRSRGIDHLLALVKGNPTLSDLRIIDNQTITKSKRSTKAAIRLFKQVRTHPNLRNLSLPGCCIGDSQPALSAVLNSGATTIILNENRIGSDGALAIAHCFESNPPLEHLELDKNRLNDADAIHLQRALKRNTNLKALFMRGNSFTIKGVQTMFRAMLDTSTMNAIADSNHVCQVSLFSRVQRIAEHIGYLNAEYPEASRKTKLLTTLWGSPRDSLLHYLEGVPVECMPYVLGFILAHPCYHNEQRPRNIVYSICRYWNMPSLYAYRSTRSKSRRKRKQVTT